MKKKNFLGSLAFLTVTAMCCIFLACSKDKESEQTQQTSSIVGTWRHGYYDIIFRADGTGEKYEFYQGEKRKRGTFTYTYNPNTKELNVITSSSEGDRWKATVTELTATTLRFHQFYYYTYARQTTEYSKDNEYTKVN